jgi:NIMA (never in mitosis gene a)-related kinase
VCTWLTALGVIVFCAIKARPLERCQKANLHSKDSKAASPANDLPASAAAALDAAMSRTEYSDYRPVRGLGRGTHSTVVLLESTKNGDLVACKRTPLDGTAGAVAAQVDQVEREICVLRMCAHQNIVAFRHLYLVRDELHLVLEFASNGTLARRIEIQRSSLSEETRPVLFTSRGVRIKGGAGGLHTGTSGADRRTGKPFTTDAVCRWIGQLAAALEHIHELRVAHRDLSATNVLLGAHDDVKLCDFGSAAVVGSDGRIAAGSEEADQPLVGTPYYMSPQAVARRDVGLACDLWALGVVIFELVTLQRPFRAENFDQLVLVINACSYDEALLSGCLHPPRLRLLASRDGLLHVDSAQRATLALVQAELAAVQASMARAKQEQPEATPLIAESSDTDDGAMTDVDDMLAAAEAAVAEMQAEVAMGAEVREAARKENVAVEKPPLEASIAALTIAAESNL